MVGSNFLVFPVAVPTERPGIPGHHLNDPLLRVSVQEMMAGQTSVYKVTLRQFTQPRWLFPFARWLGACVVCGEEPGRVVNLCDRCLNSLPRMRGYCPRCGWQAPELGNGAGSDLAWLRPERPESPQAGRAVPGCGRCRSRRSSLGSVQAAFAFGFPLSRVVHAMKYEADLACARTLASLMPGTSHPYQSEYSLTFIPVPLHRSRLEERGFNQALLLARGLKERLGGRIVTSGIRRTTDTVMQAATATWTERKDNVRGAFEVAAWPEPPLPDVVLVDDVMTSGATLEALASAVRRAGLARRVHAWVLARTLQGHGLRSR